MAASRDSATPVTKSTQAISFDATTCDNARERSHWLVRDKDIEPHHICLTFRKNLIREGRVARRNIFQCIEEASHEFSKRHFNRDGAPLGEMTIMGMIFTASTEWNTT